MWSCFKKLFNWFKKKMCTYTTFIDEAGNTLTDLQTVEQPYFVIAAVSVPRNRMQQVMSIYQHEFETAKQPNDREIKGRIWVKRQSKQMALQNIIDGLRNAGCIISVVVVEKRRMIIPLAINKFFDNYLNGSDDNRWVAPTGMRQATAKYYYDILSDSDIEVVCKAFDCPSADTYTNAIQVLKTNAYDDSWRDMLDCSLGHIPDLLEEDGLLDDNGELSSKATHSPNLTAYHSLMNCHVKELEKLDSSSFIIFDHCKQCNKDFEVVYKWMKKMKGNIVLAPGKILSNWNCIKGFDVADSKKEKALQFADIIASSVYFMLLSKKEGKTLNSYELYIESLLQDIASKEQYWEI